MRQALGFGGKAGTVDDLDDLADLLASGRPLLVQVVAAEKRNRMPAKPKKRSPTALRPTPQTHAHLIRPRC